MDKQKLEEIENVIRLQAETLLDLLDWLPPDNWKTEIENVIHELQLLVNEDD